MSVRDGTYVTASCSVPHLIALTPIAMCPDQKLLQYYSAFCPKRTIITFKYSFYHSDVKKVNLSHVFLYNTVLSTKSDRSIRMLTNGTIKNRVQMFSLCKKSNFLQWCMWCFGSSPQKLTLQKQYLSSVPETEWNSFLSCSVFCSSP